MNAIAEPVSRLELIDTEPQPTQPVVAQQPAGRQLSVVEYAMQNGASASEVRALVELQIQMDQHKLAMMKAQDEREREKRMEARELAFRKAFAAFRGENIAITHNATADRGRAGSFTYAEFKAVCDQLSPPLSKHGFGFRHDQKFGSRKWTTDGVENDCPWVWVTCFLEHEQGHSEKLELEGPAADLNANTPAQNMQATASLLKRLALLAITGTATGGEDDENRMRKREAAGNAEDEAALRLVDAGEAEAKKGLAALTKWWGGRTAKERNTLSPSFKQWRAAAVIADQQRGAA